MTTKSNRKIVKYHKPFQINIGIIIFVVIFLYLMYYVYSYFTNEHIPIYEVQKGTITQDTTFEGLILRDETVYYSNNSGYINYYCKDGTKASVGNFVFSVDEDGSFYEEVTQLASDQTLLSEHAFSQIENVANEYLKNYSNMDFSKVYQYKYDLEATWMEVRNLTAKENIQEMNMTDRNGLYTYKTENSGIITYYTDGLETVTVDTFTDEMTDSTNYVKNNFLSRQKIVSGEPAYKMINSEIWHIIIPVSSQLAKELMDESTLQIKFKKDNSTMWVNSKIWNKEGNDYLILELQTSMIRFIEDRYVKVELLLADATGLKIPNSAITTKQFLTVPKDYITKGGNSNENGLLIVRSSEDGKEMISFMEATLFYETEDVYYISSDDIKQGDIVQKTDSTDRYRLIETETLEGVYNVNRGYTVFRRIEKMFENETYTIIKSGTSHGISMYDHIALDSHKVMEGEVVR